MLVDDFIEFRSNHVFRSGYRHDASTEAVKERLGDALVHVIDRDALALAAHVCFSRPSSVLSALSFVRLPYPRTWIEFSNIELREAMSGIGSPNLKMKDSKVAIERSGFLISETAEPGVIRVEIVKQERTPEGRGAIDLSPVEGIYHLTDDVAEPEARASLFRELLEPPEGSSSKVRDYYKTIARSDVEFAASEALRRRLVCRPHQDQARYRQAMREVMDERGIQAFMANQEAELRGLFMMTALPVLILLNTRNSVVMDVKPAPDKLNKQRAKKGRLPIPAHRVVRIKLSEGRKRYIGGLARSGASPEAIRSAVVTGHFKVRKTGVFWWNWHERSGRGLAAEDGERAVRILTA